MRVPFLDLKAQYHNHQSEIDEAIRDVIEHTAFIKGRFVSEFESAFAKAQGVKHCIGVGNGTDAIYIALKMMGIGAGDEVITTATSWIATSETITLTGAKPVFVDIDPVFNTIDVTKIEAAITPRTKAIIPVHIYGQMTDMEPLLQIASRHNLRVIEDCAQSHFSKYKEHNAGTMGDAGTFSFYPGKNLGAYGDAGAIITSDDDLAEKCRMFANHGQSTKNQHWFEGTNSRLDGLQAAILSAKLPHILDWNEGRRTVAAQYSRGLKGISGLFVPEIRPETEHTFHIYAIKTKQRNTLKKHLADAGIDSAIHYPTALPFMKAYEKYSLDLSLFTNAKDHADQELSLPVYPEMSSEMVNYVVDVIRKFPFTEH